MVRAKTAKKGEKERSKYSGEVKVGRKLSPFNRRVRVFEYYHFQNIIVRVDMIAWIAWIAPTTAYRLYVCKSTYLLGRQVSCTDYLFRVTSSLQYFHVQHGLLSFYFHVYVVFEISVFQELPNFIGLLAFPKLSKRLQDTIYFYLFDNRLQLISIG